MPDSTRFEKGFTWQELLTNFPDQQTLHNHHYQKAQVTENDRSILSKFEKLNIAIITLPWCGDSVSTVPVIARLIEGLDNIEMRILDRDQHPDIMDKYLTNGARAVPKFVFFDKQFKELAVWGPRPAPFQAMFEQFRPKLQSGEMDKVEVHQILRREYARDRGRTIVDEITGLLKAVLANTEI